MDKFETPNPDELQPEVLYNYDLVPGAYPISNNRTTNTYDQFIMLRDTLVYSKKYYKGKAWATLVIWDREETVEVKRQNKRWQKMNPNRESSPTTDLQTQQVGPYVSQQGADPSVASAMGQLWTRIQEDWYYRVWHKEEIINIPSDAIQIWTYVELYHPNADGTLPEDPDTHEILPWQPIAVFDRHAKDWWDYTIGDLWEKMTGFGLIERNLERWDILALRLVYKDTNGDYQPLELQDNWSNRWSIEYLNLPLKD